MTLRADAPGIASGVRVFVTVMEPVLPDIVAKTRYTVLPERYAARIEPCGPAGLATTRGPFQLMPPVTGVPVTESVAESIRLRMCMCVAERESERESGVFSILLHYMFV